MMKCYTAKSFHNTEKRDLVVIIRLPIELITIYALPEAARPPLGRRARHIRSPPFCGELRKFLPVV